MAEGGDVAAGGRIVMDILGLPHEPTLNSSLKYMVDFFDQGSKKIGGVLGKGISSELTKTLKDAQQGALVATKTVSDAQTAVASTAKQLVSSQNTVLNAWDKVQVSAAKAADAVEKSATQQLQANTRAARAMRDYTTAQRDNEAAGKAAAAAQTALTDAEKAQEAALTTLTGATEAHAAAVDRAGSLTTKLSSAATIAGAAISTTFVAGVGMAVDKAAQFQTTQTRLVTSAGETASNLKLVSDGILNMAGSVGISAQDLSKGMYTVESAGYHGADSLKVLQAAAQGAKMEGADLTTVADAVSTALTDYHLPADQAAKVTSQLVTAVGQGKTTMEEFSSSLHSITPLASEAGITLPDVTGALAEMTSHGMSADQASQNLADTLRHMIAPTSGMRDELAQTSSALTKMGEAAPIGSVSDLQNSLSTRGLSGTLETLSQEILKAEGPDGTMLLNAFNSSKDAAANLQTALKSLPPDMQTLAQGFVNGSVTLGDWQAQIKALPADQQNLAKSFMAIYDKANGFSTALKNGSPQAQNYVQSIKALTGDATGLNTTLMLTGKNFKDTSNNINVISGATTDAKGNVKGWDDIQKTFNQRLSEAKASLGALGIQIGNIFLPAASDAAKVLGDVAGWLQKNKGFADALVGVMGGITAAFVGWKLISGLMKVNELAINGVTAAYKMLVPATEAATAAEGELDVAMDANPIGAIVLAVEAAIAAIAGLTVGVMYAWQHWGWFRTAVTDTWNVMKEVGEWIGHTFMGVWRALSPVLDSVVNSFGAFEHAADNVGHALDNFGHAVMNVERFVSESLRIIGAVAFTAVAVPFKLAFDVASKVALDFWHVVIEPMAHGIEAVLKWLNAEVFQPQLKDIETIFRWLGDEVIHPVIDFIKLEIRGFGNEITWVHDQVIDPTIHLIGDLWHWLYDKNIKPAEANAEIAIHALGTAFKAVYDDFLKPIGDDIGKMLTATQDAFKTAVKVIDETWKDISKIVGTPVYYIVDFVYNKGIEPVWNSVASLFGLGTLKDVGTDDIPHYATGGIVPGWSPGRDDQLIPAKNSGALAVSGGESIMRPEWTQAVGSAYVHSANQAARSGGVAGVRKLMGHFDDGGIFGELGHLAGKAVDAAEFVGSLFSDPIGSVKHLFSDVLHKAEGTPDSGYPSVWVDTLKKLPTRFVDEVVKKAEQWVGLARNDAGSFAGSPAVLGWIAEAVQIAGVNPAIWLPRLLTLVGRESGGNPNAINTTDSNALAGDPSRGIAQTTGGTFSAYRDRSLPDDIYNPVSNLVAAIHYIQARYGDITAVQQGNASLPPKGYEAGGITSDDDSGDGDYDPLTNDDPTATAGVNDDSGTVKPEAAQPSATAAGAETAPTTIAAGVAPALDRALSDMQTNAGHPYTEGGDWDCSGVQSRIYQDLIGGNNAVRAFNTTSDFGALGFREGTGGLYSIGVLPKPGDSGHMVGLLNGHRIESAGGKGLVIDGNAMSITDSLFTKQYYLPGAQWNPAYSGDGATPDDVQERVNRLSNAAKRYQHEADDAMKEAGKEKGEVTKYLNDAATAEALAAKSSGKAKARHEQAAQNYRNRAAEAQDRENQHLQKAQEYQQEAQQADQDAKAAAKDPHNKKNKKGKNSKYSDDGEILSLPGFFGRLGEIFGESVDETTGFDSFEKTVNDSKLLKAGVGFGKLGLAALQATAAHNAGQPEPTSLLPLMPQSSNTAPLTTALPALPKPPKVAAPAVPKLPKTLKGKIFDSGGMLMPNEIALNLGSRPEPVLSPTQWESMRGSQSMHMEAGVLIKEQHIHSGDERKVARETVRQMNSRLGSMGR